MTRHWVLGCMLAWRSADLASALGASPWLVSGGRLFVMRSELWAVVWPWSGLGVTAVKWNNHSTFLKV